MRIIDEGRGVPLVLVPGLQGRWEYLRPTVEALARSHRVITFSLCDEPGWQPSVPGKPGFDAFVDQIDAALTDRGLTRAVICGVSFGGVVALRYAASRPDRTAALVVASAPGPGWHLKPSHRRYVRRPWLSAPLFLAGAPIRLRAEIRAAIPDRAERLRFVRGLIGLLLRAPLSPARMAARARLIDGVDNAAECGRISAPTLLITGEPALDHVVPAAGTCDYAALIAGACAITLERTGHLGCFTRPRAFADAIVHFLQRSGVKSCSDEHAA
jgi:pimeloyl-ACP methyl ester carboxylesterase